MGRQEVAGRKPESDYTVLSLSVSIASWATLTGHQCQQCVLGVTSVPISLFMGMCDSSGSTTRERPLWREKALTWGTWPQLDAFTSAQFLPPAGFPADVVPPLPVSL